MQERVKKGWRAIYIVYIQEIKKPETSSFSFHLKRREFILQVDLFQMMKIIFPCSVIDNSHLYDSFIFLMKLTWGFLPLENFDHWIVYCLYFFSRGCLVANAIPKFLQCVWLLNACLKKFLILSTKKKVLNQLRAHLGENKISSTSTVHAWGQYS